MSTPLSEYLKAINETKSPLLDGVDPAKSGYNSFVVARCLSYFPDTLFAINEMNMHGFIDPKMHFDFLRGSVRKRKRYSKWIKREENPQVKAIVEYYGYSQKKAREALNVLSKTEIDQIVRATQKGGKV